MAANDYPAHLLKGWLVLGVTAFVFTDANLPSLAQNVTWGQMSALLQPDMTEQKVVQTLGYTPNKVELHTCGQQAGSPWTCKIYTYGDLYSNLKIHFRQDGQLWVVNSWYVFP